jgi:hypothetical protein
VPQDFVLSLVPIVNGPAPPCPIAPPKDVSGPGPYPPTIGKTDANNQMPFFDQSNPWVATQFVADPLGRIVASYGPFVKQYTGTAVDYSFPNVWAASPNYPIRPTAKATIVTTQNCGRITIRQLSGPRTMFQVVDPSNQSSPVLLKAGGEYTFQAGYVPNQTVGTIEALEVAPGDSVQFVVAQR